MAPRHPPRTRRKHTHRAAGVHVQIIWFLFWKWEQRGDEWRSSRMDLKKLENSLVSHKYEDAPLCPSSHRVYPGTYSLCRRPNNWQDLQLRVVLDRWNRAAYCCHDQSDGRRTIQAWRDLEMWTLSLWYEKSGRSIFRATMSHKRFNHITRALPFDDKLSWPRHWEDKLAVFRQVWDMWTYRLVMLLSQKKTSV